MIAQIANAAGGGLGDLMNLVPTPGRLVIIPLTFATAIPAPAGPPYIAMFNPENWDMKTNIVYYPKVKEGNDGLEQGFHRVDSPTLNFDLLIDGTGASGENREVLAEVLLLREVVLFNGVEHKPNLLAIIWGSQFFKGVLTSMNVKYTLFRANGIPLRATISLSFVEQRSSSEIISTMNLASADLTHKRLVKENDRLDLICQYIYKSPRHYIDVARANNLTTFRKLPVGAELIYPPVEK